MKREDIFLTVVSSIPGSGSAEKSCSGFVEGSVKLEKSIDGYEINRKSETSNNTNLTLFIA